MKCQKCGNEYPSQYYFATPTICTDCFRKMPPDEQQQVMQQMSQFMTYDPYPGRVGFGPRLGAYVIDLFIYMVIFFILLFLTGNWDKLLAAVPDFLTNPEATQEVMKAITPLSVVLSFVYYSLEIFFAATPGKMLLGLQIGNDNKTRASVITLGIRFIVKHIDLMFSALVVITTIEALNFAGSLLSFVILIGFFFVLAEKRQGFHDMLAKTAVYRRDDVQEKSNSI